MHLIGSNDQTVDKIQKVSANPPTAIARMGFWSVLRRELETYVDTTYVEEKNC